MTDIFYYISAYYVAIIVNDDYSSVTDQEQDLIDRFFANKEGYLIVVDEEETEAICEIEGKYSTNCLKCKLI